MCTSYTIIVVLSIVLQLTEGVQPSVKPEPEPTASSPHTPSIFVRQVIHLDDSGSISMKECVERDGHSELCLCDWLIHLEQANHVHLELYVDIPDQQQQFECGICYLSYGYINADEKYVLEQRLCGQNKTLEYDTSLSVWLRFVCSGPNAHHKLNWTKEDGTDRLGFSVIYTITEQKIAAKQEWNLSSSFALTVALMAAMAFVILGFTLRRSCRHHSIQRALWEIKQESAKLSDPQLTRAENSNISRHKLELHEMPHSRPQVQEPPLSSPQQNQACDNQISDFHHFMDGSDIGCAHIDVQDAYKPVVKPRPLVSLPIDRSRSPTRSNHTYISITHTDEATDVRPLSRANSLHSSNDPSEIVEQQLSDCTITLQQRKSRARSLDSVSNRGHSVGKGRDSSQCLLDDAASNPGSTSSVINPTCELTIDESRQKKLLAAPRYTSPQIGPIPHIIVTRPSVRSHRQVMDDSLDDDTNTQQQTPNSSSVCSLPGHLSREKLQQITNYNSADGVVTSNNQLRTVSNLKIKPKNLYKDIVKTVARQ